jgi:DNA-binding Xre family transcriptional regulator
MRRKSKSPAGWQGFICYSEGELTMAVSYKKLWKLLIDKDIKKKDLCSMAGVSPATITKMGKNGHVTTEVLLKICTALDCGIDDIMEIIPESLEV